MSENFLHRALYLLRNRKSISRLGYNGPVLARKPEHAILKKCGPVPPRFDIKSVHQEKI